MHWKAALAALLVSLALPGFGEEPIELETYDVRDIVTADADFPAPDFWLQMYSLQIATPFGAAAAPPPGFQAADLVALIKEKLFSVEFADPATSIEDHEGKLVVMQRPAVHKLIGQFLRRFRELYKPQILVKSYVAAVAEIPEDTCFNEDGLAKILRAGTVIAAPRLVCFNKQRVHTLDGKLIGLIAGMTISGTCYDPTIDTALDGMIFEARPTLSTDRTSIELDLRFDSRLNVAKRSQTIGLADAKGVTTVAPLVNEEESTVADKEKNVVTTTTTRQAGPLLSGQYVSSASFDLISADTNYIQTQVVAPAGKWVLAAVFNNRDPQIPQKYLLLFVTAEVLGKKITDKDLGWVPTPQPRVQPPVPPPEPPPAVEPPTPPQKPIPAEEF